MAGGNKRGVFNTRERAVSDDLNRIQRFAARERARLERFKLSVIASDDLYSVALASSGTVGDPLEMHVYEGLVVLPQAGTSVVHVGGGVAWMVDPDGVTGSSDPSPGNPDDAEFKIVDSLGISDASLSHSANAGPGIRIDVIECQRTEIVQETDNRDIFDPSTGLFTATSVTKVSAGEFTFRLREGVAGAGFPGTAQGWTPLAVASAPAAFASVNDITYWDVRPLVSDRVKQPFNRTRSNPPHDRFEAWVTGDPAVPTAANLSGIITSSIGSYRAGGTIRQTSPTGADFDAINLLATEYSDGLALTIGSNFHVWCLHPFGLPRWARYDELGSRFPGPFNGIISVSLFPPAGHPHITPSVAISPPAATGLLGTTTAAALMFAGRTHPSAGLPAEIRAHSALDGVIQMAALNGPALAAPTVHTGGVDRYIVSPNIEYPANCRAIWVAFLATYAGVAAGVDSSYTPQATVHDPFEPIATATPIQVGQGGQISPFVIPASGGGALIFGARIPLRQEWGPGAMAPLTPQHIGISWNPAGGLTGADLLAGTGSAAITGWEF